MEESLKTRVARYLYADLQKDKRVLFLKSKMRESEVAALFSFPLVLITICGTFIDLYSCTDMKRGDSLMNVKKWKTTWDSFACYPSLLSSLVNVKVEL